MQWIKKRRAMEQVMRMDEKEVKYNQEGNS